MRAGQRGRSLLVLRGEAGSVLILVMWTVIFLSILVAGLGSRGVFALDVTGRLGEQMRLSYLALGGVQYTLTVLARDPSPDFDGFNEEWVNNEVVFARQPLGEGWFTVSYPAGDEAATPVYGVIDEERKLNLNTAPEDVLYALIRQANLLQGKEVTTVVETIQDWRDEDKEQRPSGAEDSYYRGLSDSYECKDGPFEDIGELRFIKGMPPSLLAWLTPYVTVYGSGKVNLNTADPVVLRALGLSETGVNGLVLYRLGEDNTELTADDRALAAVAAITGELASYLPAEDVNRLVQLAQAEVAGVGSEDFRVWVEGATDTAAHPVRLECVVSRDGAIKSWSEF